MKTTYLDNEIILLEGYKKEGTISHYQKRKLAEYKQIKQLLLHNVVGQSEQLTCPQCKSTNILSPDKDNDAQCIECAFIWAG